MRPKHIQLRRKASDLSYEHVIQRVNDSEIATDPDKKWSDHVKIAKTLLTEGYFNRMAIAEIAIRATVIKSGGDRHSAEWRDFGSMLTLRSFAEAIEINPSTLSLWVNIKQMVFDKLDPVDRDVFHHDAAEKTTKILGKKQRHSTETIQKTYQKLATQTKEQKALSALFRYVGTVKKIFLKTDFWKGLTPEQVDRLRTDFAMILSQIVKIQQIKNPRPLSQGRKSRAKERK